MVDLTATDDDDDDDDDEQNMKMPAKWKCPRCTSLNNNCASICIACDYNPIEDGNEPKFDDSAGVWGPTGVAYSASARPVRHEDPAWKNVGAEISF